MLVQRDPQRADGALEHRGVGEVEVDSRSRLQRLAGAPRLRRRPSVERSTSVQPVNRFSRFQVLSPWRSRTHFTIPLPPQSAVVGGEISPRVGADPLPLLSFRTAAPGRTLPPGTRGSHPQPPERFGLERVVGPLQAVRRGGLTRHRKPRRLARWEGRKPQQMRDQFIALGRHASVPGESIENNPLEETTCSVVRT